MTEYSSTATRILDVAQALIQQRGYHAISFNDIALEVGIKKPSVIHHFASKSALGIAVVKRYREMFLAQLESVFSQSNKTGLDIFHLYCIPYKDFGESDDKICLCGALAGEFMALPKDLSDEVAGFFDEHAYWLSKILQRGLSDGSFTFTEANIDELARHFLNALQGALMIKRATGNKSHLNTTINLLVSRVTS